MQFTMSCDISGSPLGSTALIVHHVSLNGVPDPSKPLTNDVDILNFALLLEYLFATDFLVNKAKSGQVLR
jgi:hypothetical protein